MTKLNSTSWTQNVFKILIFISDGCQILCKKSPTEGLFVHWPLGHPTFKMLILKKKTFQNPPDQSTNEDQSFKNSA